MCVCVYVGAGVIIHWLDDYLNWMGTREEGPFILEILILGWYNLGFCMVGPLLLLFILLESEIWRASL